nr:hypothetical protein BaRGS_021717 [Batillaria attramentaria]
MDAENEHFRFYTFMRLKLGDNGKKILQDLQAVFGAKCVEYHQHFMLRRFSLALFPIDADKAFLIENTAYALSFPIDADNVLSVGDTAYAV